MKLAPNIRPCAMPAGKWRRTIGNWNCSFRKDAERCQAHVRRVARGAALGRRRTLSPQASLPPADARRQAQPRTDAGVGAEPLLLSVDYSDEGRDYSFAGDGSVVSAR